MDKRDKVNDFLFKSGIHHECVNFKEETEYFLNEMKLGLLGKSCLEMIPSFITDCGSVSDCKVIALDAGGTNFRVAVVGFDKDLKGSIEYLKRYPMPGTGKIITRLEFFDELASRVMPVADASEHIGFCFSYSAEILPGLDARINSMSKESGVQDIKGALIGENLNAALLRLGCRAQKSIAVLNDTTACLLGGRAHSNSARYSDYMGFVLGTGINACYYEQCRNIEKRAEVTSLSGKMIINTEAGGYIPLSRCKLDEAADAESQNPGEHFLEKAVSGAYLGRLTYKVLEAAAEYGVFDFGPDTVELKKLSSAEVHDFAASADVKNTLYNIFASKSDRETARIIAENIIRRAAKYCAVILAGIMFKTGKGTDERFPVCVTAEGTTFSKSVRFREYFRDYIAGCLSKERGLYPHIISAEDSTVFGAAYAGLMRR